MNVPLTTSFVIAQKAGYRVMFGRCLLMDYSSESKGRHNGGWPDQPEKQRKLRLYAKSDHFTGAERKGLEPVLRAFFFLNMDM